MPLALPPPPNLLFHRLHHRGIAEDLKNRIKCFKKENKPPPQKKDNPVACALIFNHRVLLEGKKGRKQRSRRSCGKKWQPSRSSDLRPPTSDLCLLSFPCETFHLYKFTTNRHIYLYKNKRCVYLISQKTKQTTLNDLS